MNAFLYVHIVYKIYFSLQVNYKFLHVIIMEICDMSFRLCKHYKYILEHQRHAIPLHKYTSTTHTESRPHSSTCNPRAQISPTFLYTPYLPMLCRSSSQQTRCAMPQTNQMWALGTDEFFMRESPGTKPPPVCQTYFVLESNPVIIHQGINYICTVYTDKILMGDRKMFQLLTNRALHVRTHQN